jgi:hypothetical protein
MRKFQIGESVYTFVGQRLLQLEVKDYYDELRLSAEGRDAIYCVYEIDCHLSKHEAFMGMMTCLHKITLDTWFAPVCNHEWKARMAKLPSVGFEIPIEPVRTEVYCHLCGSVQ